MSNKAIKQSVILITVVAVIAIGLLIGFKHHKKSSATPISRSPLRINTANQPTLGNPNAKVKIVAFEDLKCMMCKLFNISLYPKIKKDYVATGKASYSVINLAFIPGSMNAAVTARCLFDQNPPYFFKFVDYIYRHQGAENENWTTVSNMLSDASKIPGVDIVRLGVCVSTSTHTNLIRDNLKYARKIMGSTVRTPSIYVNGILVSPLTMERFKQIYDLAASS